LRQNDKNTSDATLTTATSAERDFKHPLMGLEAENVSAVFRVTTLILTQTRQLWGQQSQTKQVCLKIARKCDLVGKVRTFQPSFEEFLFSSPGRRDTYYHILIRENEIQ
jgi:hypothetical protein